MSTPTEPGATPIRLLVLARHPFSIADLGFAQLHDVETVHLIRRPNTLEAAIDEIRPTVVMVDTAFPDGRGISAIATVIATAPDASVLALTPAPSPYEEVALAVRAGALGFVEIDEDPERFAAAVRAVHRGQTWLPTDDIIGVLDSVAEDIGVSAAEQRSRLTSVVIALIPLMGVAATVMSLLWRRYLGHIGVRPVDLAIDPATRVIDAVAAVALLLGIFGPLLFIGSWIDLAAESGFRTINRRKLVQVLAAVIWLVVAVVLGFFADLVLLFFVGPLVGIALLARILDVESELPAALRITRLNRRRASTAGVLITGAFLTVLSTEALLIGPDFRPGGVDGWLAPRVLGFSAQPMLAIDVGGERAPREVLYLGGNADLYVLVDPCDDDRVEFVSVGSTRLEVIETVTCDNAGG